MHAQEIKKQKNYAFIDFHNLFFAVKNLEWLIDYRKFRIYLTEKYSVNKAYIFIGFLEENQQLYNHLQSSGFVLIFKPVLKDNGRGVKGNCDAELVLQSMIDIHDYDQAILVTGDGDFYCLVKYLVEKGKLGIVLAPADKNCSSLLKRVAKKNIALVSDLRNKVEYKKRTS
ncbi:MAG: NYN domain-containing protein [Candidatus Doudnabacteria bacterium]|nr:NYN domain-containing protein [Candidatus Doudnabacteria bacterium]